MAYPDPSTQYETAYANNPTRRGPLRFEEGVATDTDVPTEFGRGAYADPGAGVYPRKQPEETMRERAHVGSASWIEAPMELSEFVQGVSADHPTFERVVGSEYRQHRPSVTQVSG